MPCLLPPILHFRIGPFGLQLSHILLDDCVVIISSFLAAIFVMIDAFLSVAMDNALAKKLDRFIGDLSLPSSLFHVVEVADRVLGTAALELEQQIYMVK